MYQDPYNALLSNIEIGFVLIFLIFKCFNATPLGKLVRDEAINW